MAIAVGAKCASPKSTPFQFLIARKVLCEAGLLSQPPRPCPVFLNSEILYPVVMIVDHDEAKIAPIMRT